MHDDAAAPRARLNVLVVSFRSAGLLAACLGSVTTWLPDASVSVWDNRSDASDAIRELARSHPEAHWTFSPDNVGFARAVNALAARTTGGDLLLLNPDAELLGDLAATRALLASDPRIAAAAPFVLGGPGHPWDNAHREPDLARQLGSFSGWSAQRRPPRFSDLYDAAPAGPVGYLTGACLLIARRAWEAVGPFDERYFLYSEEADWAARARAAGWTLRLAAEDGVRHAAGGTVADSGTARARSRRLLRDSQVRYLADHHGRPSALAYAAATSALGRVQRSKRAQAAAVERPAVVISSNTLHVGGAERQRVWLANGLAARGYPVTLSLLQEAGPLRDDVRPDVDVVLTPWRHPRPDIDTAAVLVTGTTNTEAAFGTIWRHAALGHGRRRWLVAAHTPPLAPAPTYSAGLAALIRRSDGVIALSRSHWEQLTVAQRLHGRAPFIVANGIPAPAPAAERPPAHPDGPRLVFAGRLVEHKGVQVAIDALARLADRPWSFDVYGDGPYRAELEAAVPASIGGRVRFRGWVADPSTALRDADLVVLPSRLEAQPIALIEAMWAGTPVLANPVGAVPDLLAGGAGLLTTGTDVAAWTDALRRVLDAPAGLAAVADRGRRRATAQHDLDSMLDGYERAIREVLAR